MSQSRGVYDVSQQWRRVVHGPAALEELEAEAARLGFSNALLLTTPSLTRGGDLLERVAGAVSGRLAGIYDGARQHVPRSAVVDCANKARELGCDGIVSLGGGSVIDTGKAVALALAEGLDTEAGFDPYMISVTGSEAALAPALSSTPVPHVALPSTLSGAEFSSVVGIVDERSGRKDLYADERLAVSTILLSPVLAAQTPWPLWSSTGVKVLSDAIEQLYSRSLHPVLEPLLLRAIEGMMEYLPRSRDRSPETVLRCQLACWMGMFGVFATGTRVGIAAGLRHQLGGSCNVSHGQVSGVLLPHVLRYNLPSAPGAASSLAASFDLDPDAGDLPGRIADRLSAFVGALGLPTTLTELGVTEGRFAEIADNTLRDFVTLGNPRTIGGPEEIVQMLRDAS